MNESKGKEWLVYILKCRKGKLYTGITTNLQRRFDEHLAGKGGHFTKAFSAKEILFSEKHKDRKLALRREAQIKKWTRKKKLALINKNLKSLKAL